jgi:DNA-binding transcriptional LysR family regulator
MIDLVEERIDVAIRTTPAPDSSLIVRRLTHWHHILCASPAYLKRHGEPKTLAELAAHNCLRYALYPYGDEWRFTGPDGKPAAAKVAGNLVSASAELLRVAAVDGRGIFLAPDFYAFEEIAKKKLVPLLPQYRAVEFSLNAIYANRQNLPAKVRAFIDLLAERTPEHWAIIGKSLKG